MRNIIKRLYDRFQKKNDIDIHKLCRHSSGELNKYCMLEYTYHKQEND